MNTILSIALGFNIGIILILIAKLRKAKYEAWNYQAMYEKAWETITDLQDKLDKK